MKPKWLSDARLIPDEVMTYIRILAVRAVIENGRSPEEVIRIFGMSRSCIYDWLNRFEQGGYAGLETQKAPGYPATITEEMEDWLKETVLESTPIDFGYSTSLWTCAILSELLFERYDIQVVPATINHHMHKIGLSVQKPRYISENKDLDKVRQFVEEKFPKIQRFAEKVGADIGFEDESSVDLRNHSGTTWGSPGKTPTVRFTGKRARLNLLSVVTSEGNLRYHVTEKPIDSKEYIRFLKKLIKGRSRPVFLIVDQASFHRSTQVRIFIWCNRRKIRLYYLPPHSPECNPDEHVWEEIKDKNLNRQRIIDKEDLKKRVHAAMRSLQHRKDRLISFFHLPETLYAA